MAAAETATTDAAHEAKKVSLSTLTAMVVGSIVGSGVFAYAKAEFGNYVGFNAAFGYWASACAGTVSYWVLIMSTGRMSL